MTNKKQLSPRESLLLKIIDDIFYDEQALLAEAELLRIKLEDILEHNDDGNKTREV
jgi:hypothetical protein